MIRKAVTGAVAVLLVGFLLYVTVGIAISTHSMPPVSP